MTKKATTSLTIQPKIRLGQDRVSRLRRLYFGMLDFLRQAMRLPSRHMLKLPTPDSCAVLAAAQHGIYILLT